MPVPIDATKSPRPSRPPGGWEEIAAFPDLRLLDIFGRSSRKGLRRSMTRSPAKAKPVAERKYRYSKLRWRISVRAVDSMGWLLARAWRKVRAARRVETPRRILIVQLDHLGDAVLTSPLIAQLKAAYPDADVDVLASGSNHEVFEANTNVSRVRIARRTWFERHPTSRGFVGTVWGLGRSLRDSDYDLGIDVRGDILSILVLTLAGIPRRIGFAMGGGSFMLTDIAPWVSGRHETHSRLALLEPLGIVPAETFRTEVHVSDDDRAAVAAALGRRCRLVGHVATPRRSASPSPRALPRPR